MKIKTSELVGPALDWVVASLDGYTELRVNPHRFDNSLLMTPPREEYGPVYLADIAYSTDWAQGGPIIERSVPVLMKTNGGDWIAQGAYDRVADCEARRYYGPTPLIAAMRCYVASKLGNEVEVPEELT